MATDIPVSDRTAAGFRGPHPKKFLMWLYVVSMVMIFAGFTSGLVVSMSDNVLNHMWKEVHLPFAFTFSTLVILASSITFMQAATAVKNNQRSKAIYLLLATLGLGLLFCGLQFAGYNELIANGAYLVGNVSGSWIYVISGAHAVHVLGGVLVLLVQLVNLLRGHLHSGNMLGLEMAGIFWHSLDLLWVYLFFFLYYIYS